MSPEVKTQQDNGGKFVREREKRPKAICQNPEVRLKCWHNAYPKVLWLQHVNYVPSN